MDLGAFSISLSVSDMEASKAFYEKLGFASFGGDGESWDILRNGDTTIGLFHGLFEGNILTFNPGWAADATQKEEYTDIRQLRANLVAAGMEVLEDTTQDSQEGPASFALVDPDGNPILIDQHI